VNTVIQKALLDIEERYDVRVLYACESGSRAWGFASEDSDWDGRFIYIHPRDWYLTIESRRDVIEEMLPGDLDLSGWDIRKAMLLLRKSNPPLLEWLDSPIVYRKDKAFFERFLALSQEYYSDARCFYHYWGMAVGNVRNYFQTDLVPLKKYLYVLRPLLACQWIEQGKGSVPMRFETLVDGVIRDSDLRSEIDGLISAKRAGGEMGKGPKLRRFRRLSNLRWCDWRERRFRLNR